MKYNSISPSVSHIFCNVMTAYREYSYTCLGARLRLWRYPNSIGDETLLTFMRSALGTQTTQVGRERAGGRPCHSCHLLTSGRTRPWRLRWVNRAESTTKWRAVRDDTSAGEDRHRGPLSDTRIQPYVEWVTLPLAYTLLLAVNNGFFICP